MVKPDRRTARSYIGSNRRPQPSGCLDQEAKGRRASRSDGWAGSFSRVLRGNRFAFSGDLRRNALHDFAGGAGIDENVELGLAEQVDEAGRDDKTCRVDGCRSGCVL